VAVATVEEKFFLELLRGLGLDDDPDLVGAHKDRSRWPALRAALMAVFASRTRDEWAVHFAPLDACVTPVLDLDEAAGHPHAVARGGYVATEGTAYPQPAVSPRFSRSSTPLPGAPARPGEHARAVLTEAGYATAQVDELLATGVARQA
jgi:alpha-methylacyl-CoA racemase